MSATDGGSVQQLSLHAASHADTCYGRRVSMSWDNELWNNSISAWVSAFGVAILISLLVVLARSIIARQLARVSAKTETRIDDAALVLVNSIRQALVLLVAIYVGSRHLQLPPQIETALRAAAVIAVFVQVGLWAGALLNFWLSESRTRALRENAGAATGLAALGVVARVVLWALIALLALDNLGVNVTALVAGLGVGGIAIALAVQNILGDLFASLSIVMDKPFVIGDFIVVDDCAGTVEHVGLKTTRLRSLSGEQLVFANSDLLGARLHNYKRMKERRVLFGFGVLYGTPPEQVEEIGAMVRNIIEAQPQTRFDRAHFKGFGESSLDFEVVYWMLDPDYNRYMDTQQSINLALLRAFADAGVGFAFPTRTLELGTSVRVEDMRGSKDEG
jgi:small-conductance mechanosensitive channel